jgi:hypothetical protein
MTILTEKKLNKYYSDNGVVVRDMTEVYNYLTERGFIERPFCWRHRNGRTARIYRVNDAMVNEDRTIAKLLRKGFLISFGGAPVRTENLKFTKY